MMSPPLRRFEQNGYLPWAEERNAQIRKPMTYMPWHVRAALVTTLIFDVVLVALAILASGVERRSALLIAAGLSVFVVSYTIATAMMVHHRSARLLRGELRVSYRDIRLRALMHAFVYDSDCKVHKLGDYVHPRHQVQTILEKRTEVQRWKTVPFNLQYTPGVTFRSWASQLPKEAFWYIDTYLEEPSIIDADKEVRGKISEEARSIILTRVIELARKYTTEIVYLAKVDKWLKAEVYYKKYHMHDELEQHGKEAEQEAKLEFDSDYILKKYSD